MIPKQFNPEGLCPREPHAGGSQLDFRGGAHPSKGTDHYPIWIVPSLDDTDIEEIFPTCSNQEISQVGSSS